jgi:spore germination cell wall hydrolase CwlJ-like protein
MIIDLDHANADLNCMAMAIYAEAHTQSIEAKHGVAQVILNRFREGHFGNSICEVVYNNKNGKWQFNGVEDIVEGKHDFPSMEDLLKEKLVAHSVYFHKVANPIGLTTYYFHDDSISLPFKWIGKKRKVKIDNLIFY